MNESTPPQAPSGAPHGRASDRFFAWLRGLGIARSDERWFAGVASGIAAKAGIDPLIVRGVFVVLAVLGGPGILLYLAAWLLLPDAAGRIHVEELLRGRASAGVITAVVILGAIVVVPLLIAVVPAILMGAWFGGGPWNSGIFPDWLHAVFSLLWFLVVLPAVIIGVIVWIARSRRRRFEDGSGHQDRPPYPPHATHQPQPGPPWHASAASQPATATATTVTATTPTSEASPEAATSFAPDAHTAPDASSTPPAQPHWSERVEDWGRQTEARAREWGEYGRENHRNHRLGAAHIVLTLAAALIAAGIAAAWTLGLAARHAAVTNAMVLTAALVAAVAVLAISLIIAGIRGKQTGAVGFLSFLGVVALIFAPFTSILPQHTQFLPFGNRSVTATPHQPDSGIVMIAGTTRIDLRELTRYSEARDIEVWLVAGGITVELPEQHPVEVHTNMLAGGFRADTLDGRINEGGPFFSRTVQSSTSGVPESAISQVRIHVLAGSVRIDDQAYERKDA